MNLTFIKFISTIKDSCESKYQLPKNKRESVVINYFKDPDAFMEFLEGVKSVYKNTDKYNPKKSKVMVLSDGMIANMLSN